MPLSDARVPPGFITPRSPGVIAGRQQLDERRERSMSAIYATVSLRLGCAYLQISCLCGMVHTLMLSLTGAGGGSLTHDMPAVDFIISSWLPFGIDHARILHLSRVPRRTLFNAPVFQVVRGCTSARPRHGCARDQHSGERALRRGTERHVCAGIAFHRRHGSGRTGALLFHGRRAMQGP